MDPLERGVEDFLTMFGSSGGEVCCSPFSCDYFSLSLPLFKAQMSRRTEEPRTADKARTSEEAGTPNWLGNLKTLVHNKRLIHLKSL